ncbi:MAG: DNA translocase FtsK 4TM domain-containing protein [bacterium]
MSRKKRRQYQAKRASYEPQFNLSPETKRGIAIVLLFAVAGISLLSLFGFAGRAGELIATALSLIFGWGQYLFPLVLILLGYFMINPERYEITPLHWVGLFLFELSFHGLLHLFVPLDKAFELVGQKGGGYIGLFLSYPLTKVAGFWVALLVILAVLIISLLIMFNASLNSLLMAGGPLRWLFGKTGGLVGNLKLKRMEKEYAGDYDEEDEEGEMADEEDYEAELGEAPMEKKKKPAVQPEAALPKVKVKISVPMDLLDNKVFKPTSGNIRNNQTIIQKTLENFGIDVEMGEVSVGPTVTQYTLKPIEGVKLSQITTLHNDLALALAAHPIRIEAPIPGKALVGIEVPNQSVAIVTLREVLDSDEFRHRKNNLGLALGKDVAGQPWLGDLGRMPHLLIAGSTGSGKTVCMNTLIVSLLYQNNPDDLKFIMVDPKRVELPVYNGIPYLVTPVITQVKETINALKWSIREMDRRFELLNKFGKRDILSFNSSVKPSEKLPYLVIVIDELADLMASAMSDIEASIVRLAQMSRAVGIHLIVATQRPSVEVITGLIKANITSRIAFSVASMVDSRTILDTSGAEKLLGRGDMLFTTAELSKPKRIQGVFVSDAEIKRVVEYLKNQAPASYVTGVTEKQTSSGNSVSSSYGDEDGDDLLDEAKEVILQAGKASASLLQRRLKVGYARAARILDILEEHGFIGPADGAKPREILSNEIAEEDYDEEDDYVADEAESEIEEEEATPLDDDYEEEPLEESTEETDPNQVTDSEYLDDEEEEEK